MTSAGRRPRRAGRRCRTSRPAPGTSACARCSRRSCSASTSTPATARRLLEDAGPTRVPTAPRRWRPRRVRRPRGRRAERRDATTTRRGRPASTSTPTCARSTSSARACRSGSATTSGAPSPTTAWPTWSRARRSRRPCCGSSSPSSGASRSCRRHGAARRAGGGRRRRRRALRETLDRLIERHPPALPGGRQRWAAPCATGASTGRTSTGPGRRSSATMRRSPPGSPVRPSTGSPRRARRLPAAAGADPGRDGLLGATPTPGRLLEVLIRRYYKIRELGPMTTDGPTASCPAVRPPRPAGARRRHPGRGRCAGRGADPAAAAAAGVVSPDTAVVDVYLPLPRRRPTTPTSCRPSWPPCSRRSACPAGAAGRAGRLASRRADRRAHVPPGRRRRRAAVLDGSRARGARVRRRSAPSRRT